MRNLTEQAYGNLQHTLHPQSAFPVRPEQMALKPQLPWLEPVPSQLNAADAYVKPPVFIANHSLESVHQLNLLELSEISGT